MLYSNCRASSSRGSSENPSVFWPTPGGYRADTVYLPGIHFLPLMFCANELDKGNTAK